MTATCRSPSSTTTRATLMTRCASSCSREDPRLGDMRLHVAVADVSHYVREGTEVDREAAWRCFSVYLPDRAIPMLPEALSTHMCSLVPTRTGWPWWSP